MEALPVGFHPGVYTRPARNPVSTQSPLPPMYPHPWSSTTIGRIESLGGRLESATRVPDSSHQTTHKDRRINNCRELPRFGDVVPFRQQGEQVKVVP
jgi:hypothetical protein